MKALIHIGIEKTGTTAIQSFLTDNRVKLKDSGFAYLESAGLPSNRKLATYAFDADRSDDHHQVLGIIEPEPRRAWNEELVSAFRAEVESLPDHVHTIVISNEQLHSRLEGIDEIKRVQTLMQPYCNEIEILVYLRRQDQLATSLYSTALKCGHSFDSILPGVAPDNHYYNFEVLLSKWSEVFGKSNITARIFDKASLRNGDLLDDFLHYAGMSDVSLDGMILPGRQNESLEPRAQEYLRIANKHIPMLVEGRFNLLRERLTYQLESNFSGSPELPLKQDAIRFCAMFEESNKRVAQEWFGRDTLFENNFEKYPESRNIGDFAFEDAVEVSAEILNGITQSEYDASKQLLQSLEQNPELNTRLLADYFMRLNPPLANYIRQNIVSKTAAKKVA